MTESAAARRPQRDRLHPGGPRSASGSALLESKLTPPVRRPGYVPRAGLVNRLRVARRARVVLLTAPPGYGKTTLVAEWARRDPRPFAWYTLDETDDAAAFVTYLAAAVARVHPHGAIGRDLHDPAYEPSEMVAVIGRLLSSSEDFVVVLDEVDLLRDAGAAQLLERFAHELPSGSQLVLVGSSEPPLPLARFRAQGDLIELGVDDLRFSEREAASLLRNAGVRAGAADVEALNEEVEGWPAGLYLAALSLRQRGLDDARRRPGPRRGLLDEYFCGQLLARLSDDDVRFLTRASVLDRMCGALCDVVTDMSGSADRLERLERSSLFVVPLDRERRWYRFHHVFRGALVAELERREPGRARLLRSRAAGWCASYGSPMLALDYADAAGDLDQLAQLVERFLPFTATAQPARVARWLGALDERSLLERHPTLARIGALTWAMNGRADAAESWSDAAGAGASGTEQSMVWQELLQSALCPSGPRQMHADAERALDLLPLGSVWRSAALNLLGTALVLEGELHSAAAAFSEAAEAAGSTGDGAMEVVALASGSLLAAELCDWSRADALADAADSTVRESELDDHVASLYAIAAGARTALRRGDWATIHADLRRAHELLPRLTYAVATFAVLLRLEFARVQLGIGEVEDARRLLEEVDAIFARRPELGVLRERAGDVGAQIEAHGRSSGGRQPTLTAAELRLIPFLTTHLSFREIADQLFVSRNTVKTQAISVYRKLGVSSRGEAIARASRLGLVEREASRG